jgi:4-hydroxybenzoate polyprenyltransferase
MSVEEDAINKPYRPIPSGLVSYNESIALLFILIPVCVGVSSVFGASIASLGVIAASLSYTFLKLDNHWLTKNAMNVAIWYPFYLGALIIQGKTPWLLSTFTS